MNLTINYTIKDILRNEQFIHTTTTLDGGYRDAEILEAVIKFMKKDNEAVLFIDYEVEYMHTKGYRIMYDSAYGWFCEVYECNRGNDSHWDARKITVHTFKKLVKQLLEEEKKIQDK